MSSSDSSDDENIKLLQEATDHYFINDTMYKNMGMTKDNSSIEGKLNRKSVRMSKNEKKDINDSLDVSPEFRDYVAKKLADILDKKIEASLGTQENIEMGNNNKKRKSKIKLFNKTKKSVEAETKIKNIKLVKKEKIVNKIDFEKIAVTPEDIEREVRNWSKRTRSKVFSYKLENGHLKLVSPDSY